MEFNRGGEEEWEGKAELGEGSRGGGENTTSFRLLSLLFRVLDVGWVVGGIGTKASPSVLA